MTTQPISLFDPSRRVARKAVGERGFALIVTLSLMILLVIVAVGLLGLSAVSLRSSSQGQAKAQAQANARMALQLAIGELQKSLGPDQRISARSSALFGKSGEANVVGAWESWRWNPFGGSAAGYSEKKNRFRKWLVSSPDPRDAEDLNYVESSPKNAVSLMEPPKSSVQKIDPDEPPTQLRAANVTVRNSNTQLGGMAWGVMDESLKMPVNLPDLEESSSPMTDQVARRTAPPRARPEVVVPALKPSGTLKPENFFTLPTAALAAKVDKDEVLGRQDGLTVRSLGLQTDVVNGGFKKDLTTLFESSSTTLPGALFGSNMVYGGTSEGGLSWEYLRSHYQLYKRTTSAATGVPKVVLGTKELKPTTLGFNKSPQTERLLPVIAKLQIMFSIVTHNAHIDVPGDQRVTFFNTKATNPTGNINYGCPHLVYDPVVTLYNPYDVAIELPKLRVRIWDPPVLFGFKKNADWLRPEFGAANGAGFMGLARFQIDTENPATTPDARKAFTLLLTEKTSSSSAGVPGKLIRMEPGEVKVFGPWVETDWTWGLETKDAYNPRAFFDWKLSNNFGNVDGRSTVSATLRPFGVQAVPGWDARAGLQTDHLSYRSRPDATRYDFEKANGWNGGWLGIKRQDSFSAFAKPGRTVSTSSNLPDFQVDVLAGLVETPTADVLRSYSFRFSDVEGEISGKSPAKIINRTFLVDDLMQFKDDKFANGKSPFAILTMSAKTTKQLSEGWRDVSMPWLHNHPVVEGSEQNTNYVGSALDSYDLRFQEVTDFNNFPGIEIKDNYGFYGATVTGNGGVSNVPMFRVPLIPANSLGEMIPGNLAAASSLPRVTHPLGGSRAHPLIQSNAVFRSSPVPGGGRILDHTYLINDALWDRAFFSTLGTFSGGLAQSTSRGNLIKAFMNGETSLLNPRFVPIISSSQSVDQQAGDLDKLSDTDFATQVGGSMAISGVFNINSDSVDAWKGMLSSMRDQAVTGWKKYGHDSKDKTSFPRMGLPLGGDAASNSAASIDIKGQIRWAGFRALNDSQIENLAKAIVVEIRDRTKQDRAPSLSLAEFVNRHVGSSGDLHTLYGLLEAAIKKSGINEQMLRDDSNVVTGSEPIHRASLNGLAQSEARLGYTAEGAPSVLTQGDLLMPLAGVITARGDTFRIRAYGEARDLNGKPVAKAWCEAVVQRIPDYLDPKDTAATAPTALNSEANKNFGRRFIVSGFRWLDSKEI